MNADHNHVGSVGYSWCLCGVSTEPCECFSQPQVVSEVSGYGIVI